MLSDSRKTRDGESALCVFSHRLCAVPELISPLSLCRPFTNEVFVKKCISVTLGCAIVTLVAPLVFGASAVTTPLTLEAVNDSKLNAPISSHAKGPAVMHAQVLLDRAHFSPGEIDAGFGSNMRRAVAGFQKNRGLPSSGIVDQRTWDALNRDGEPALTKYQITEADVAGPFTPIPQDMMGKAKLPALGYGSAAEALGEKFHVKPELLQQLNPGKDLGHASEDLIVPNVESPSPLPKAAKVVVDKSDSTVSLVDESGNTIAQFPASSGSRHDPLPIGSWTIKGVARKPTFKYNPALFWDAESDQSKATIPAGPNNPVGVVWVDLSKPHYGIHGTPVPANIGKTESHGCIRLTNWDATVLADAVRPGMPAILQK
jgi:lipoprotein-anchoring transpeptidase ErfK/SrfK